MKFFVAFAAFVAVAAGGYTRPSILPAMVEDLPAFGPAIIDHEYETPAFGPAIIDFPINSDKPEGGSPVVIGPIPEGVSPLVQIIVNVARPAQEAGDGATIPSIKPELIPEPVQVVDDALEPVDSVMVVDLPDSVIVVDAPAAPAEPVLVAAPQLPPSVVNIPGTLN